ncbi:medium-chain acyl-[acyl-carrier-protein] hydrolase [Catenulispora sp. MAP12-49]|uniref:thioesterase II family protein n=1 Tax=Catenulispora sp. MAP12-49 TaxID=3156302 RepID=UPI003515A673
MSTELTGPWLRRAADGNELAGQDPIGLFCLPHAGSGPARYLAWADRLDGIDLIGVCLPGHERRIAEAPLRRVADIVDALAEAMSPYYLQRPFGLFGHSFGGLLAFELALRLEAAGARPLHVFLSGCAADPSGAAAPEPPVADLDEEAFLAHVRALGGLDPDVLAHPDLVDLVIPALRADYEAAENHTPDPAATVAAPITALGGLHDPAAPPGALIAWARHTAGPFSRITLPGGHFALFDQEHNVLRTVRTTLTAAGRATRVAGRT